MDVQDLDDKVLGEAIVKALEQMPAERIYRYSSDPATEEYEEDLAGMVNVDTDFSPPALAAAIKRLLA